jgi:two-component system, sensor histidine kinase
MTAPPISVLYVEDDPGVLEATLLLLETCGYRVATAKSLGEALHRLDGGAFEPDVILTDNNLGAGEVGVDVVAGVRERFARTVPAIIMTGNDWVTVAGAAAHIASCRVLRKPVDVSTLTALIELFANQGDRATHPGR